MAENLLVGVFVGIVVFVTYLSHSAKKSEMKEKAKQDEFTKRLENLNKVIETEVSIKTDGLEKVNVKEEKEEMLNEGEPIKFKARRNKKDSDNSEDII